MKLYADLSKRVVVDTNEGDWIADEIEGVFHMPLHADGDEQVRLTKMDPGCTVPYTQLKHRSLVSEPTRLWGGARPPTSSDGLLVCKAPSPPFDWA